MREFKFVQSAPATQWVVTHNFNGPPVGDTIIAYNGTNQKVLPASVVYTSSNVLTINFSVAVTGEVRLIGRGVPLQPTTSTDTTDHS